MNDLCKVCYAPLSPGVDKCDKCGTEVIQSTATFSDLLSTCAVCSARISRMALTCPGCGHPVRLALHSKTGTTINGFNMTFRQVIDIVAKVFIASIPCSLLAGFILWLLLTSMGIL